MNTTNSLPLTVARQVDDVCGEFEAAWLADTRPDIVAFADRVGEPARTPLLRELIRLDAHYRRKGGETPTAGEYAARFPELDESVVASATDETVSDGGAAPRVGPAWPAVAGFELLGEIGRGGMGVVYRARDLGIGREVAVKRLQDRFPADSGTARRFVDEARITGQLQHPGIPAVYQVGLLPDGRPFLAMKLIKGDTLDDLLKAGAVNTLAVFEGICQAVGYAHAHGVIHRDLKPQNVMVGAFGEVQVMDWGLAKLLAPGTRTASDGVDPHATAAPTEIRSARDSDTPFTQYGSVMGTPAYMAPEQAAGETDKVDRRSDVFGLGAVLCKLLTGQPPFGGKDADSVRLNAVRGKTADALARLDGCGADPGVVALCKRCLSVEPADRPASANEVAAAVADLRRASEERARQAERDRLAAEVRAAEQTKRRRAIQWAGGAVAAVLLLGVAGTTVGLIRAEERRQEADRAWQGEARQRAEAETQRDKAVAAEELAGERLVQVTAEQAKTEEQRRLAVANEKVAEAETKVALAVQKFLREKLLLQADTRIQANALRQSGRSAAETAPNPSIRELLDRAAAELTPETIDRHFPDEPRVQAGVMSAVGNSYRAIGKYRQSAGLLERALALSRKCYGPAHGTTLAAATDLASTYHHLGRLDDARTLLEDICKGAEAAGEADHPYAVVAAANLAFVYGDSGKPEKAVELLEAAHKRALVAFGPGDPEYLTVLNSLGVGHMVLRRFDTALPLLEQSLKLRENHLGPDHPDTGISANNLAHAWHSTGRLEKALPLWERFLGQSERSNGPDHPDTLQAMNNLAGGYWSLGRLDKSVPLFEQAEKRTRARFGDDDPETLNTAANLGVNYRDAGRVTEALSLLEEVYRKGGKSAKLAWVGNELATAYRLAGKVPEATKLVRERLADARKLFTAGSPQLAGQLALSGSQMLQLGAPADAEPLLRECLTLREKLAERKQVLPWQVANTRALLGQALAAQGKYADAEPLLTAGHAGLVADEKLVPPAARPNIAGTARALAALYAATGRPEKAAEWQAKVPRETLPKPRPAPEK